MSTWSTITWDVARTSGFLAFGLVTISVALGLVLSLRWRSSAWPRWATTDLHRYITLLALVFTGLHTLAIWLDPFMAFTPAEVFIPMATHYRPLWVALGIVAAYLLLAIWLSERIQKVVGYGWWRRLHYLTFGIYALVAMHGIASGSDTRTSWAMAIYASSFMLVGVLLAIRLLEPGAHMRPHPRIAAGVAVLTLIFTGWTISGPLRPGWNAAANNGNGSGARIVVAQGATGSTASSTAHSFTASFQGSATQSNGGSLGGATAIQVDATLSGGARGRLQILLRGQDTGNGQFAVQDTRVSLTPSGGTPCTGSLTLTDGGRLTGTCAASGSLGLSLAIQLQMDAVGDVSGTVRSSPA